MKNQALFSSKDKSKKLKCCLLQFLFGALRVKDRRILSSQFVSHGLWLHNDLISLYIFDVPLHI